MTTNPNDKTTADRDYAESKRFKQILAAVVFLILVAFLLTRNLI